MSDVMETTGRKGRVEWMDLMLWHLSQQEFCKAHEVPYGGFYYSRKKLSPRTKSQPRAHSKGKTHNPSGSAEASWLRLVSDIVMKDIEGRVPVPNVLLRGG